MGNDLKHFNTFGIIYMAGQAVMLNYYYDNMRRELLGTAWNTIKTAFAL